MKQFFSLVLLACSALCAQVEAENIDVPVTAPAADQARLGITSTKLETQRVNADVSAIIRSVDPVPLAVLYSDLLAATAAAAASGSELQRIAGLAAQDRSASQQALELARARAAADAAAVSLLRQRLALEWGPEFLTLSDESRRNLVDEISSGAAALLRADAPERPAGVAGKVFIELSDNIEIAATEVLGLSGTADQRMQTIGLYCVLRGEPAKELRPGRVLNGRIQTEATTTGVVLPRSALIRTEGRTWAYVRTGQQTFVRREVVGGWSVPDGWFVDKGFEPGTAVVDKGAGSLAAFEVADELAEPD